MLPIEKSKPSSEFAHKEAKAKWKRKWNSNNFRAWIRAISKPRTTIL